MQYLIKSQERTDRDMNDWLIPVHHLYFTSLRFVGNEVRLSPKLTWFTVYLYTVTVLYEYLRKCYPQDKGNWITVQLRPAYGAVLNAWMTHRTCASCKVNFQSAIGLGTFNYEEVCRQ